MTITRDVTTEDTRTGTDSPHTFNHAAASSGVKGVVLCLTHGTSSTDHVTAASYGGVAMIRYSRATDTVTEPGAAEIWFVGANIPQGTQTVSYTCGATTDDIHAACITLLAADDTEVIFRGEVNEDATNPSVTTFVRGRSAMAFAAFYSGLATPASLTAGTNCTKLTSAGLTGTFSSAAFCQTTASTSNFAMATTAASDDVAYATVAVAEVSSSPQVIWFNRVANGASGTGVTLATGFRVAVGDVIVVMSKHEGAATTYSSISETGSLVSGGFSAATTYSDHSNNDMHIQMHYGVVTAAGIPTMSQTLAAARTFRAMDVYFIRKAAGRPSPVLATGTAAAVTGQSTSATAVTAGTVTAEGVGVAIMALAEYGASNYTPGSGWTEETDVDTYGETRTVTSGASIAGDATASAGVPWICQMVEFFTPERIPLGEVVNVAVTRASFF